MRRFAIALLAVTAVLGGCNREPDFDKRYDDASRKIVEKAKAIDAQIAATGVPGAAEEAGARPETAAN